MGAFTRHQQAVASKPSRIVIVPPSAFADDYEDKPKEPVRVGLRLVSEQVFNRSRTAAAQDAWKSHPENDDEGNRIDRFNQKLVGLIVAHAAVEPENAAAAYFGPMAEDKILRAMTSEGIRMLYDEYETYAISVSPTAPEATDDELGTIADGLESGSLLQGMDVVTARRARRLLRHVLDMARPDAPG